MKKESKSIGLFKIAFITVLVVAVLTWIVPSGIYDRGNFQDLGVIKTSIYDFFMSYYYVISYLLYDLFFLICVGGFYGVLARSREYSAIVTSIANKIKGRENIFIILVGLIFALFTSINYSVLFCVAFIPFVVNVLAKNGVNKFKTFAATFGSMMVGIMGMTFNQYYGNLLEQYVPVAMRDGLVWKFVILGVAFFILMSFVLMKIDGPKTATEDMFTLVESEKKVKKWPVALVLSIFAIFSFISFTPWQEAFDISVFNNTYNKAMDIEVGSKKIVNDLFDNHLSPTVYDYNGIVSASYEKIFDMVVLMIIVSFIISKLSKMRTSYYISSFGNGIKKIIKPVGIFILVNCIFVLMIWSPIGSYFMNKLAPGGSEFNCLKFIFLATILAILHVDHGYTLISSGTYLSSLYLTNVVDVALIMNTMYGLVQFIVPSGYLLFFALSYLDISYKDYLSNMWKFILALCIAAVAILVVSVYV